MSDSITVLSYIFKSKIESLAAKWLVEWNVIEWRWYFRENRQWESRLWRLWKNQCLNLILGIGKQLKVFVCLLACFFNVKISFSIYSPNQLTGDGILSKSNIYWQNNLASLRYKTAILWDAKRNNHWNS